jgi:molybdenum cofactor cytidylyltransferase
MQKVTMTKHRIAAVILAAGGSTRFGSTKQLHRYDGEPLVKRAASAALNAGADPVVVVLGSDADAVAAILDDLPQLRVLINPDWTTGLASSLRVGLNAVASESNGILVTLADQPMVDALALKRLIEQFDDTHRIVASSYADAVGVPVVFGTEFVDELSALTGERGAGQWLRKRMPDVTTVPLEAAAIDIDTAADAARLKEL